MRVAPNIYLVASGVQGCSLTGDLDCNCWLFDTGRDLVLFDTGAGLHVDGIFAALCDDGLAVDRLTHVFLTHAHADHSGGADEIRQRTGCKLHCGQATAELLGKGEDAFSLAAARIAGVYPRNYRYRRPVPDVVFAPDEVLTIETIRVTAIPTPGHSSDHTSFLVEGLDQAALVTGDAMMHSGRIIYQDIYDFDVRQSAESIRRLATLEFDALLPGHGLFVRTGGRRHVGGRDHAYGSAQDAPPYRLRPALAEGSPYAQIRGQGGGRDRRREWHRRGRGGRVRAGGRAGSGPGH